MRDEHCGAQNSTKIVQPRGNVNEIILYKLVLHKTFLRNMIDREWAPSAKQVKGKSKVVPVLN
jgi:hypothetical protein